MSITFTHVVPGTHDPEAETFTASSTSTVTGSAIQVQGIPRQYAGLNLVESEAPTLLFTPSTYGELPSLGDTIEWNDVVYRVRAIFPIAPDGVAIMARVIVSR